MDFLSAKSKKSLVFVELKPKFPKDEDIVIMDSFSDKHIFLISSNDPWYRDILINHQTLKFSSHYSRDEQHRIRYQAKHYLIISDTLYRRGVDSILHRCLTHEEAEIVLNDCHSGACGGHLFGLATTQKIMRVGYFWPKIFKDCVEAVKRCHPCQIFCRKMWVHPAPLFLVIIVSPFTKWWIDFTTCHPPSARGHHYIIMAINYFTKWVEATPMFANDDETATLFIFNQIISKFEVPKEIVTNHGNYFQNRMMMELTSKLGFKQEHSSLYYPQANGQVEVVNKSLKTILQRTINASKSNRNLMLYLALWVYRILVTTATGFSPFQLIHGVEAMLSIECEIPSLKIVIELLPNMTELEAHLVHLEHLDEQRQNVATTNETHKKHVKSQYDKFAHLWIFSNGDLVLVYDQDKDALGAGKFNLMWHDPYIVSHALREGAHELSDYEGNVLSEPKNGSNKHTIQPITSS